jgi:hypothetical protein
MPAALPGSTLAQNVANPSAGRFVIMDALSGPKGSPFDKDNSGNASTGALSTGIGYAGPVMNPAFNPATQTVTALGGIRAAGFDDDDTVGVTKPDGSAASDSTLCYIGGGRSVIAGGAAGGLSSPSPYTAGFGIAGAGQGGSRDGGAGPAFTGFAMKTVTATAGVANGAVVETGFVNRSGAAIVSGQSVFGSATAALAAAS